MKKTALSGLLLLMMIVVVSCTGCDFQQKVVPLPSFAGITVDENTIFLLDRDVDYDHYIYAFDTATDRKIHSYRFKGMIVYGVEYDYTVAKKLYIELLDGRFFELDLPTGKTKEMKFDFGIEEFFLFDGKLWILPLTNAKKGNPVSYLVYSPLTEETEWIELPEGISQGFNAVIKETKYCTYIFSDYRDPGIYNYTTKKIVDVSEINRKYMVLRFFSGYLCGGFYDSNENLQYDVYQVDSLEPLMCRKIFTTSKENQSMILLAIYESEKYIFLYSGEDFEVRDRISYDPVGQIKIGTVMSHKSYFKNGFIWCAKEEENAVCKINMEDLSYQVIK